MGAHRLHQTLLGLGDPMQPELGLLISPKRQILAQRLWGS